MMMTATTAMMDKHSIQEVMFLVYERQKNEKIMPGKELKTFVGKALTMVAAWSDDSIQTWNQASMTPASYVAFFLRRQLVSNTVGFAMLRGAP